VFSFFEEDSMVRRINSRLPWLVACAAVFALAVALPAAAQSTGMVKGVVKDVKGEPVDGAKVVIEMSEGTSRRFETKSNKRVSSSRLAFRRAPTR
jgi:hypothetical protein